MTQLLIDALEEKFPGSSISYGSTEWSDKLQLVYVKVSVDDLVAALEEIKNTSDFSAIPGFRVFLHIYVNYIGVKINVVEIIWHN